MSMGFGMPGPRVLGVISWCPEGSKGGNVVGFFRAHAYLGIQRGLRGAMQWVSLGPMPGLSLLGVLLVHFMVWIKS